MPNWNPKRRLVAGSYAASLRPVRVAAAQPFGILRKESEFVRRRQAPPPRCKACECRNMPHGQSAVPVSGGNTCQKKTVRRTDSPKFGSVVGIGRKHRASIPTLGPIEIAAPNHAAGRESCRHNRLPSRAKKVEVRFLRTPTVDRRYAQIALRNLPTTMAIHELGCHKGSSRAVELPRETQHGTGDGLTALRIIQSAKSGAPRDTGRVLRGKAHRGRRPKLEGRAPGCRSSTYPRSGQRVRLR